MAAGVKPREPKGRASAPHSTAGRKAETAGREGGGQRRGEGGRGWDGGHEQEYGRVVFQRG